MRKPSKTAAEAAVRLLDDPRVKFCGDEKLIGTPNYVVSALSNESAPRIDATSLDTSDVSDQMLTSLVQLATSWTVEISSFLCETNKICGFRVGKLDNEIVSQNLARTRRFVAACRKAGAATIHGPTATEDWLDVKWPTATPTKELPWSTIALGVSFPLLAATAYFAWSRRGFSSSLTTLSAVLWPFLALAWSFISWVGWDSQLKQIAKSYYRMCFSVIAIVNTALSVWIFARTLPRASTSIYCQNSLSVELHDSRIGGTETTTYFCEGPRASDPLWLDPVNSDYVAHSPGRRTRTGKVALNDDGGWSIPLMEDEPLATCVRVNESSKGRTHWRTYQFSAQASDIGDIVVYPPEQSVDRWRFRPTHAEAHPLEDTADSRVDVMVEPDGKIHFSYVGAPTRSVRTFKVEFEVAPENENEKTPPTGDPSGPRVVCLQSPTSSNQ